MAARRTTSITESWRERIKVGMILDRLNKHIDGQVEMSPTQVQAAKILLGKVIPDVKFIENKHSGSVNLTLSKEDANI